MSMIEAHDLEARRGGRRVFAGLSFAVEQGEAVILRGPNGAGKSTLLRLLAGFCAPSGGSARIGGFDVAKDPASARALLAYAGHLDALKPSETCRAALAFWARLYGAPPARVEAALGAFELHALAETPGRYLSAGQKRRLGLARLALTDRPLWLLDEPTVSLDAAATALMARRAREHLARGGTILAATHIDLGLEGARVLTLSPAEAPARRGAPMEDAW